MMHSRFAMNDKCNQNRDAEHGYHEDDVSPTKVVFVTMLYEARILGWRSGLRRAR